MVVCGARFSRRRVTDDCLDVVAFTNDRLCFFPWLPIDWQGRLEGNDLFPVPVASVIVVAGTCVEAVSGGVRYRFSVAARNPLVAQRIIGPIVGKRSRGLYSYAVRTPWNCSVSNRQSRIVGPLACKCPVSRGVLTPWEHHARMFGSVEWLSFG